MISKPPGYRSQEGHRFIEEWYESALSRWSVPFLEHRLETHHGDTYALEFGASDALPLVLLHAAGTNSAIWADWVDLEALSEGHHVYAVDVIGDVGRSLVARRPKRGAIYADWLSEVLRSLDIEGATLLGASFGAVIALSTAQAHPERLRNVVAFVPPGAICRFTLGAALRMGWLVLAFSEKRFVSFCRYANGGVLDIDKARVMLDFLLRNARLKNRSLIVMPPRLSDRQLVSMEVPCLCYLGEKDPFYKARKAKRHLDGLDCNVEVELLPGQGHFLDFDFDAHVRRGLEAGQRQVERFGGSRQAGQP
jgi:pimeloyl-ACP methyl ester carboxylesterase